MAAWAEGSRRRGVLGFGGVGILVAKPFHLLQPELQIVHGFRQHAVVGLLNAQVVAQLAKLIVLEFDGFFEFLGTGNLGGELALHTIKFGDRAGALIEGFLQLLIPGRLSLEFVLEPFHFDG